MKRIGGIFSILFLPFFILLLIIAELVSNKDREGSTKELILF